MKLFSPRGSKSTWFERLLLLSILIFGAWFAFAGLQGQVERHLVFRSASAKIFNNCVDKSQYAMYKFFSHHREDLYTCIVDSKDQEFQKAAAIYMLKNAVLVPENNNEKIKNKP